ncbi:hypothetical protein BofuT4_P107340.1 [Botrytis cinerea T4]|uniref:Uncharacterized protein n=2 Tax=Botryotinia fuckeliana TaxID=40559 RepID=G2Y6U8_BOTF4|nr:hypothetical protein BofuT4_P107340.1 [Botrytis cinerea T4]
MSLSRIFKPEIKNTGGRPKIVWTSSKKRKLVRLYLMTDLKIAEIQRLLSSDGFNPCVRNIQTQLSDLLPNNKKDWRKYRPLNSLQSQIRLQILKECRNRMISKHTRLKLRFRKNCSSSLDLTPEASHTGFHKEHEAQLLLPASLSPSHDPLGNLDESPILNLRTFINPRMISIQNNAANHHPNNRHMLIYNGTIINETIAASFSFEDQSTPPIITLPREEKFHLQEEPDHNPFNRKNKSRRAHTRRLSSVLSATDSEFSSFGFASGYEHDTSSLGKFSLTAKERDVWEMAIDEEALDSICLPPRVSPVASLLNRPCCGLSLLNQGVRGRGDICEICGFMVIHEFARNGRMVVNDITSEDYFGNTTLHHAAAAGNIEFIQRILSTIKSSEIFLLKHRNSSGKMFLHCSEDPFAVYDRLCKDHFPERVAFHDLVETTKYEYFKKKVFDCLRELGESCSEEELMKDVAKEFRFGSRFVSLKFCESSILESQFVENIQEADIYLRDSDGNTVLTIAASRGLRQIVKKLLTMGANPNTRNRAGTSVLGYVANYLVAASKPYNKTLHTSILVCISCLADVGAKMEPTVYDEYYISEWLPKKGFYLEQSSCGIKMMVLSRRQRDPEMRSAEQHSPSAGVSQPHFQISPMITISLMMLSTIIEEELQSVIKPAANLAQQVDSSKDEVWSRFMSMDEYLTPISIRRTTIHDRQEFLKRIVDFTLDSYF